VPRRGSSRLGQERNDTRRLADGWRRDQLRDSRERCDRYRHHDELVGQEVRGAVAVDEQRIDTARAVGVPVNERYMELWIVVVHLLRVRCC